jgi:hypothetical protein
MIHVTIKGDLNSAGKDTDTENYNPPELKYEDLMDPADLAESYKVDIYVLAKELVKELGSTSSNILTQGEIVDKNGIVDSDSLYKGAADEQDAFTKTLEEVKVTLDKFKPANVRNSIIKYRRMMTTFAKYLKTKENAFSSVGSSGMQFTQYVKESNMFNNVKKNTLDKPGTIIDTVTDNGDNDAVPYDSSASPVAEHKPLTKPPKTGNDGTTPSQIKSRQSTKRRLPNGKLGRGNAGTIRKI